VEAHDMSGRIGKFPPIQGIAYDFHSVTPPSVPPPPPAPPNPAPIPSAPWIHQIGVPLSGIFYTGKYTSARVATEGLGDLIWQHDWGPLQPHYPLPPILATPGMIALPLASQAKFFLPAFSVKEPVEGAVAGDASPVAICLPIFMMQVQTCQDIGGWGFVAPMGISFEAVSVRWVGFTLGDLLAGLIGMAGDALSNLCLSGFGNLIGLPSNLMGGIAGAGINAAATLFGMWTGSMGALGQVGMNVGVAATVPVFGVACLVSWGAGQAANAVGDAWQPPSPPAAGGGS
jgi:hypothetical protein